MANNYLEIEDYLSKARQRATIQFEQDSAPVFDRYLQLLVSEIYNIQLVLKDLMEKRSIDTSEGVVLDIIGDIVGQPRTLFNVDLLTFFGFVGHWNSGSYGAVGNLEAGSPWWDGQSPMTGNIVLEDDMYRLLIKAKIAKNVTRATPEDVMNFANFVFSTSGSNIIEEGEAKFRLMIGRPLTSREVGLLRWINHTTGYDSMLLPKPVGVGIEYGSFDYNSFFAFQGVPNAKGYGSIGYSNYYDGSNVHDGSVIPSLELETDENGIPYGGHWASFHEDIYLGAMNG